MSIDRCLIERPDDSGRTGLLEVPQGPTRIAQRFSVGLTLPQWSKSRRDDRNAGSADLILFRPFGAWSFLCALPTVKTVGYFRSSLQDFSLTPGFSPVPACARRHSAVLTAFPGIPKPLKRLISHLILNTGLKPGVNETPRRVRPSSAFGLRISFEFRISAFGFSPGAFA